MRMLTLVMLCSVVAASCTARDEALESGRDAQSFIASLASQSTGAADYFRDLDGGIALSPAEQQGRVTWLVWTAGNDRFWERLSRLSGRTLDFLRIVSSHPSSSIARGTRWSRLGLVNEPCFEQATVPRADRFGLWLDVRRDGPDCPRDPFENESAHPGVKVGARGTTVPVGSFYGYASGVVGLRLFPNPDFDAEAAKAWDAERYYRDGRYAAEAIPPYRVGMSCAFCHIGPNPVDPPADPERPAWRNLSSTIGAQFFRVDRIFAWKADESSFFVQLLHSSLPGALDTSFIATDSVNNPRAMNALYQLGPRLSLAARTGRETLSDGSLDNRQLNEFIPAGDPLAALFVRPATVWTPRVLKDGADSVGPLGALNRVYVSIGMHGDEWLEHFNPLVGGTRQTPISIRESRARSAYWEATELQTPNVARFLIRASAPHRLSATPEGAARLASARDAIGRGKAVFAEMCARCHSSKLPPMPADVATIGACAGPDYLRCWARYWGWTKTDDFKQRMSALVLADDFLDGNLLSTDLRVPVTLLETNACSPLASNATRGAVWDNFSSESYKTLPSAGTVFVRHPYTTQEVAFRLPAGGRGYTRPPSLVGVWASAPFLLNNSLGRSNPDAAEGWEAGVRAETPSPTVANRLRAFDEAFEQLLWRERRPHDPVFAALGPDARGIGTIARTTARSYLRVPAGYWGAFEGAATSVARAWFPWLVGESGIELGPIPKGTPVNLLANIGLISDSSALRNRAAHGKEVLQLVKDLQAALAALPRGATDEQASRAFAGLIPQMLRLSTCPDFALNRGHYFGDGADGERRLSDRDKEDLKAFVASF
ncbi:MAG TPA: hypothetical protein VM819_20840 [Vicinamibacterales bacterium]|nr:hypothetical protein [Vicinamibacterales bacterium]